VTDQHPLPGADVVVGGVRMHVVVHGRSDGAPPPLLLLHGLATSSHLWRDVARDLGHDRLVIAPDLLGLGRSERPADSRAVSPAAQATRLLALLDALGHDRVAVAGHELGGAVAVALAAAAPERVAALALLSAPLHTDALPLRWHLPLLLPGVGPVAVGAARRSRPVARGWLGSALGFSSRPAREVSAHLERLLPAQRPPGLLAAARAVDPATVEASWRVLTASPPPLLVLWGADDTVLRASYGRRLAAEAPGAGWVPVAGAGHLLPEERPERVAEELAAFVAEAAQPADQ
jgi:2-hydroxymuconate-semialdehyde hydrolase